MNFERIELHGEVYVTLASAAACYRVELRWVEQVYASGLLGPGERVGAEVALAEAELDRLAARVEKLRGYAVHDDDCGVNALLMPRPPLTMQCTCGLSDLLKGSEDGQ